MSWKSTRGKNMKCTNPATTLIDTLEYTNVFCSFDSKPSCEKKKDIHDETYSNVRVSA